MTLCPISMFSRILAIPSIAAPATQAGFQRLANRVIRPAVASRRWMVIIRLMYAASASPRDSSMSARIASSSRPSSSTSSSLRWVYSLTSAIAMLLLLVRGSDVEREVTGCCSDTGLDGLVRARGLVPAAQVTHGALDEGDRAGVADAHPAAVGHPDAGFLTGFHDGDGAALGPVTAELEGEPLQVEAVLETRFLPVLLGGVEHRGRATGPGLPVLPVRAD